MSEDWSQSLDKRERASFELFRAAVAEGLRSQEPDEFLRWMREQGPALLADWLPEPDPEPDTLPKMAMQLGYAIWNALPLPRNDFRPLPLPEPGRNDPCICGSGSKYKQCCARFSELPRIDPDMLWPVVVEQLQPTAFIAAARRGRVPPDVLASVAEQRMEEGDPDSVVNLLEPLFDGDLRHLRHGYGQALYVLCDAYDELGRESRKLALLERIARDAPRDVASDAAQRLAVIALDRRDAATARRYFDQAMRANPDDSSLSILELQLLLMEGSPELARQRAAFWHARLRRGSYDVAPELLNWLQEAKTDPARLLSELHAPMLGESFERVRIWTEAMAARPVGAYRLETLPQPDEDLPGAHLLVPPPQLAVLDARWHERFPVAKPFGTGPILFDRGMVDPWQAGIAEPWLDFLEANPEAADSLDVLDDLLLAIDGAGLDDQPWLVDQIYRPIFRRVEAIVRASIAGKDDGVTLPWFFPQNRPALRVLDRELEDLEGDAELDRLRWLLRLNPPDNYGWRAVLIDLLLQAERDDEAAELAARYPDDMFAETLYGGALALHRLGRGEAASQALDTALERLPTVAAYLTGRRRARPKQAPGLLTIGGDDQAYQYAQYMGSVWKNTPGALDWLRQRVRAHKQRSTART